MSPLGLAALQAHGIHHAERGPITAMRCMLRRYLQRMVGPQGSPNFASWNFEKYLVDRRGFPVRHYGSAFDATTLEADIEAELAKPAPPQDAQHGGGSTASQ